MRLHVRVTGLLVSLALMAGLPAAAAPTAIAKKPPTTKKKPPKVKKKKRKCIQFQTVKNKKGKPIKRCKKYSK